MNNERENRALTCNHCGFPIKTITFNRESGDTHPYVEYSCSNRVCPDKGIVFSYPVHIKDSEQTELNEIRIILPTPHWTTITVRKASHVGQNITTVEADLEEILQGVDYLVLGDSKVPAKKMREWVSMVKVLVGGM